jgi:hypothetical protein
MTRDGERGLDDVMHRLRVFGAMQIRNLHEYEAKMRTLYRVAPKEHARLMEVVWPQRDALPTRDPEDCE